VKNHGVVRVRSPHLYRVAALREFIDEKLRFRRNPMKALAAELGVSPRRARAILGQEVWTWDVYVRVMRFVGLDPVAFLDPHPSREECRRILAVLAGCGVPVDVVELVRQQLAGSEVDWSEELSLTDFETVPPSKRSAPSWFPWFWRKG